MLGELKGNQTAIGKLNEVAGQGAGAPPVPHDNAAREYVYGPDQGLLDTTVGAFTQAIYNAARKQDWIVIDVKNDRKKVISFEHPASERPASNHTTRKLP